MEKLVKRISIDGISKALEKVKKGHIKPPFFWVACNLGKSQIGNGGVIRTFQGGEGYPFCECS